MATPSVGKVRTGTPEENDPQKDIQVVAMPCLAFLDADVTSVRRHVGKRQQPDTFRRIIFQCAPVLLTVQSHRHSFTSSAQDTYVFAAFDNITTFQEVGSPPCARSAFVAGSR